MASTGITSIKKHEKRILVVEDDPSVLLVIKEALAQERYVTEQATTASGAFEKIASFQPHLVLTDHEMPGKTGLEMLHELRKQQNYVTVLFISGKTDPKLIADVLRAGADDFIKKPFRMDELLARVEVAMRVNEVHQHLLAANQRLLELVELDDLTGLYNMRSMYDKIDVEIKRARRFGRYVGCVMVDLDHFKLINDKHDHLFGSQVIKLVGHLVKKSIRDIDFAARYGGDEFLVILTETTPEGVHTFTERLRAKIESEKFEFDGQFATLTASLGYSVGGTSDPREARDLVRSADRALYKAKEAGRNRIEGE